MKMGNLSLIGALGFAFGWAGIAIADVSTTSGTQTALPLVSPGAAAYTLGLTLFSTGAGSTIDDIVMSRDDTSPCVGFTTTIGAGKLPAPFAAAGKYFFTYRPELDVPLQVPLPGAPATNVDPMSHWTAVQTVGQALIQLRTSFNSVTPPTCYLTIWVDPLTASATGGPLYANEFYKFEFSY